MKVSIVTIAYNSETEIEATIESVLRQDYENLEYWIIDGCSKDKTVEKAEQFRESFRQRNVDYHIVSEPDKGIYDAMNKGIALVTGDVIGLINSGDRYEPDAVSTAVKTFREAGCDLMYGNIAIYRADGKCFEKKARQRKSYQTSRDWNHPTMFVKSELYKQYPFQNKGIHDDYAFYLKMRKQNRKVAVVNKRMANFSMGGASNQKNIKAAWKRIQDRYRYCYRENGYSRLYFLECLLIEAAKWILG